MDVSNLIQDFGEDSVVKVWPNKAKSEQLYPGGPTGQVDIVSGEPEILHEPVLPLSSHSAIGQQLQAGGASLNGMLVWYSQNYYPSGSVVEIPAQSNGRYQITDYSSYNSYAKFWEYVLKGDSQDGISY